MRGAACIQGLCKTVAHIQGTSVAHIWGTSVAHIWGTSVAHIWGISVVCGIFTTRKIDLKVKVHFDDLMPSDLCTH